MAYILAKLKGVPFDDVYQLLKLDAPQHAKEGLDLLHVWKNIDNPNETFFLYKTDNIERAKDFIHRTHSHALRESPNVNLPEITFLEEEPL